MDRGISREGIPVHNWINPSVINHFTNFTFRKACVRLCRFFIYKDCNLRLIIRDPCPQVRPLYLLCEFLPIYFVRHVYLTSWCNYDIAPWHEVNTHPSCAVQPAENTSLSIVKFIIVEQWVFLHTVRSRRTSPLSRHFDPTTENPVSCPNNIPLLTNVWCKSYVRITDILHCGIWWPAIARGINILGFWKPY